MGWFNSSESDLKKVVNWAKELKINLPYKTLEVQRISKLDLSFKGINKIPGFITSLSGLKELNLSFNYLNKLPKEIKELKNLRVLDLGYNRFTEVPSVIFDITNLEVLNFEANMLKKIPAHIAHLKELNDINLFANQISELPQEIVTLKNMRRMNLAVNQIQNLPAGFEELTKIEVLELWLNKFDLIPKAISQLPKLHDLYDSFDSDKINKALIRAVFADNLYLAGKLIFNGADVNYKMEGFGSHLFTTPLFEARSAEMVELLFKKGANPHLKRELIKTVLNKNGDEEIKHTGNFETFLTRKNSPEIVNFLKKTKIPKEEDIVTESDSSDVFF
jgi:hypothetical protein